jgi:NDP-sugar pyrophosphorylase family protein
MKTKLLILAAGMGSRFGGIKQMAGIGPSGEAVLEYSVYDALEAGFDEAVFLVRSAIEADFRSLILPRFPSRVASRLAFQELGSLLDARALAASVGRGKPWGTGHALLCAEEALGAPFAVINADDFYGRASFAVVHEFLASSDPQSGLFCMAGFGLSRTTSPYGSVSRALCDVEADGSGDFLRGLVEHKEIRTESGRCVSRLDDGSELEIPGDAVVSMNLFGFTPAIFAQARPLFDRFIEAEAASPKKEFYLPDLVNELVERGSAKVKILPTPESWFGITYREDLAIARERMLALCAAGIYPEPLWADAGKPR